MPARPFTLNLLPKTAFEKSLFGRIIKWGLTTGRHIIIIVEIFVITAFLSRFTLDSKLGELEESLKERQSILESYVPTEKAFLEVQTRLNVAQKVFSMQKDYGAVVNTLITNLPQPSLINSINVDGPGNVSANITVPDETQVAIAVQRLTESKLWKSASLGEIFNDKSGVTFVIKLIK